MHAQGKAHSIEVWVAGELTGGLYGVHLGGAFFAESMYRFNAEIARYLRDELGCRQLINAGNWKTADSIRLNDAERWSYTANEVLAVNTYYSPVHIGPDRGWRIDKGDQFEDVSVLLNPRSFPLNIKQTAGHPMMITETHWVPPLAYQSEAPFLTAAYQSLTGVDTVFWFATGEAEASPFAVPWQIAQCCPYSLIAAMRFSSVIGTGLVPCASRCRVASNDVSATQVSSHVGVPSAFAGMMPFRRTKYPPTKVITIATNTPNTNALRITPPPHRNSAIA